VIFDIIYFMESKEIEKLLKLNYEDLVNYLLNKYGNVNGNYYVNEFCRTKNNKIRRTNDGLYIHHIKEDVAIKLSESSFAINQPFEYQLGKNLLYCNILEHFILHIKILEKNSDEDMCGIGGIENFIIPEINDYFNGYNELGLYKYKSLNLISNNLEDYIKCLEYYLDVLDNRQFLKEQGFGSISHISKGDKTGLNPYIYERLSSRAKEKAIIEFQNTHCKDFNSELCLSGKCPKQTVRCTTQRVWLCK